MQPAHRADLGDWGSTPTSKIRLGSTQTLLKVVGYVTNKVMAQSNTHASAFAGIGNSINALMKIFFENADQMFIVHPVAIYYDN